MDRIKLKVTNLQKVFPAGSRKEKDLNALEKNLGTALKEQINSGLEIKVDKNLSNGFRIGTKDGSAYYDFSAESVADLFASYLNPKNAAIMKEAAKEGL